MSGKVVLEQLIPLMSPALREVLAKVDCKMWDQVEEIRLREDRPLMLNWTGGEVVLNRKGRVVSAKEAGQACMVSREDIERTLQLISNCSLYAFEEELRRGYMTVPGGHRIGLCGKAVVEKGRIKLLHYVSSLNFRIAREIKGGGEKIIPYLVDKHRCAGGAGYETKRVMAGYGNGLAGASPTGRRLTVSSGDHRIFHTLVISPPQGGKTTLLRDLARCLSEGMPGKGISGFKIGLVDERSEIAGCYRGVPQMNVGTRTDVLDCAPKAEGMMMLLRSMSPEIIITDEIGREEDADAIVEVINAGITVIASAHAAHTGDLSRRPSLQKLLDQKVFRRIVILGRSRGVGTVEKIIDPENKNKAVYGI